MSFPAVRRALIRVAAVLVFLVLAGATYQGVATALERRQFPRPGRLVDVGGRHQLHLNCSGEGSPTVVLEAGGAGMSAAWGWVQPRVAKSTRVCSYDRAGLGWSDAGDGGYDPAAVAPALNTLLDRGGERGPFVLVGQGLGAAFATLYASQFGDRVVALVLVDPPADARPARAATSSARLVNASPWLARTGVLRAMKMLSSSANGLPQPAAGALGAFLNRPDHLTRAAAELSRWDDAVSLADSAPLRDSLPVQRVDAGGGGDRVAFLTNEKEAAATAVAVLRAVATARAR